MKQRRWLQMTGLSAMIVAMLLSACGDTKKENSVTKQNKQKYDASLTIKISGLAYDGEYVIFGRYEQDMNIENGEEPVEWVVLDDDGSKMLLISRYVLDTQPYHTECTDVTWEECSLRSWLNEYFYNVAFTLSEQAQIQDAYVENADNAYSGTEGGNDTTDKVFLLSVDELLRYYPLHPYDKEEHYGFSQALMAAPTQYAKERGIWWSEITQKDYDDYHLAEYGYTEDGIGQASTYWWLRSSGVDGYAACMVYYIGVAGASYDGTVADVNVGVRPVMWVEYHSGETVE